MKFLEKLRSSMAAGIIGAIVLVLCVFGLIAGWMGYVSFTKAFEKEYAVTTWHMADSATLRSDTTARYVRLRYPDMNYLGFWHNPRTEAAFVCIEPWCGVPAFDGEVDDLEKTKTDMFHLQPGASKEIRYSVEFG